MSSLVILLIDDHAMFRTGLELVLHAHWPTCDVIAAGSIQEALAPGITEPSVVLLDIQLHGLSGVEGLGLIKRKWPHVPVIMLSSDANPATVRLALSRGASDFVSKADTASDIIQVIQRVCSSPKGDQVMSSDAQAENHPGLRLTPRQCEVLDLLSQGLPNKTIGRKLFVSENTVRGHVQAILSTLDVSSRTEAIFEARRAGLVK